MADSDSSKVEEATYRHQEAPKEGGLVEEVTATAKSLIDDFTTQTSSYVTQVESLVSGLSGGTGETLPPSDKNAGEASDAADKPRDLEKSDQDETEKSTTADQPYGRIDHASWKNCCGLLDLLQRSDH